jgi:Domain of unknown function (DUF4349)
MVGTAASPSYAPEASRSQMDVAPGVIMGGMRDSRSKEADDSPPPPPAPPPPPSPLLASPETPATGAKQPTAGEVAAVRGPMLIYTAEITMAVFEVNAALARVEVLGREEGGFLSRRDDRSITIRVPAARFDDAVKRIEQMGDMLHRNVTAEDVTEEFRDLDVQLESARAVRNRLEQLLARAAKVEEAVQVERELDRVASEIDRIEGRMKFLKDRAAYSTITVSFQPQPKEELSRSPFRLPVPWLNDLGLGRLLSL